MSTKEKLRERFLKMLHKPHPGNIVKGYAMQQVYDELREAGLIKKQEGRL